MKHTITAELPELPAAEKWMKWAERELGSPNKGETYFYGGGWIKATEYFYLSDFYPTTRQIPMTHQEVFEAQAYEVGDTVKVTRIAKSDENDWGFSWVSEMDAMVGNLYEIKSRQEELGYDLGEFYFPAFVCEKVDPAKTELEEEYKKLERLEAEADEARISLSIQLAKVKALRKENK